MKTVLFVCEANVRRSQIAEWLYNHQNKGMSIALSIAWSKARKNEYNEKVAGDVASYMQDIQWINIFDQHITYINDLLEETFHNIETVIFLYDPIQKKDCDDVCKISKKTPYKYIKEKGFYIQINPVPVPMETWIIWFQKVTSRIQEIIAWL